MPAPYLTDAELLAALAGALNKADPADLAVKPETLASANEFAGDEVTGRLLQRGYTQAQIDAWNRTPEFHQCIALWWCFTFGGVPYVGNDQRVAEFDRREELSDPLTAIFIDGKMVLPGANAEADPAGAVASGRIGGGFTPLTW
jgi:hypothetical protein